MFVPTIPMAACAAKTDANGQVDCAAEYPNNEGRRKDCEFGNAQRAKRAAEASAQAQAPADAKPADGGRDCSKLKTEFFRKRCVEDGGLDGAGLDAGGKPAAGKAPKSVDWNVARIAYNTAKSMGIAHDSKIMLALFEAALVESGCRNLDYGDDDSLGFLQQRPSIMIWVKGKKVNRWGTAAQVRDVAHATTKFVETAKGINASRMSAGELAQAVQVSDYPDRYDERVADAKAVLVALKG